MSTIAAFNVSQEGLESLRRVLYAYSIYDDEVGYCQGMNFITAMFTIFLTEEEAFWLLVGKVDVIVCMSISECST